MELTSFKAYDVRGKVPSALNEELAGQIGAAYVHETGARSVVIGHDARLSGPALYAALADGLRAAGADVTGIGLCGTEEIYHAASAHDFDGGIMVTGSHNPADENGMKFVRRGGVPISSDSGLFAIRDRIAAGLEAPAALSGSFREADFREDYARRMLSFIDPGSLRPFRIVADAGNGCAGPALKALAPYLPCDLILLHGEPDGAFPHGIPTPLLPEKRDFTANAVRENRADFGLAWDGDFDRCFFYDENGRFIEGYYLVGMMAEALLARHPGAKIVHDPRLVWNTREICDSGMLPWLLVADLLSRSGRTLAECLDARLEKFPCSGEINSTVEDVQTILGRVEREYARQNPSVNKIDGLSMDFGPWRFNLRGSNTEPVLRLNVETRGDKALLEEKTAELLALIRK